MTDLVHLVAGGALIGAGSAVLALANGRIAGISGAFGNLLDGDAGPQRWRLGFLLGLLLPALYLLLNGVDVAMAGGVAWLLVAGLLVGIGTRASTNRHWARSCNTFRYYEDLMEAAGVAAPPAAD